MLIDKGYVERHPNPRSRRADLIIVNKAGRKALEVDPTHKLVEIIASIPNEDRECLVRSMKIILDGMLEFGLAQFDESLLLKLEDR